MPFLPFTLPFMWVATWVSLAMLGLGSYMFYSWYVGEVVGTIYLAWSLAMLAWSFAGRYLALLLLGRSGHDDPVAARSGLVRHVRGPEGCSIHVELYGPENAQPIVMTHGWGTDSTEWYYAKRHLGDRFRLIAWDLPGLGKSPELARRDYRVTKMARCLERVISETTDRPVIIMGHSIGGMIALSFCRLFPEQVGRRVAGLVLTQTTYTNPVKTTTFSGFFQAIQKPILEPVMHLTVVFSPLVRLSNWLGYLNGTTHLITAFTGFAGCQTRGQLDFAARFTPKSSPAVLARGMLGMFRFDETATLGRIGIPTLVIAGDHDRVLVPEASLYIREHVRTAEMAMLAPAGHLGPIEQHEHFLEEVEEFADKCAGQPQPTGTVVPLFRSNLTPA